jgi:hypothetical protein
VKASSSHGKATRRLAASFARPTRFRLRPKAESARKDRVEADARLAELKQRLTQRHLQASDPTLALGVTQASHEAASLAWATDYPLLVFPGLLEEKVELARCRAARQEYIRRRSAALLAPAA